MKWDPNLYDEQHTFVSDYGTSLIDEVNTNSGQRIWDLGCGTGILTAKLAEKGALVTGTDLSPQMIELARLNYPELDFRVGDATNLTFESPFDTVFSNAVFHWITNQGKLLNNIGNNLKSGGSIVCEMGASGNIEGIQEAFATTMARQGLTFSSPFFFPTVEEYKALLRKHGFEPVKIVDFDRPTPFAGGEEGMSLWLRQFYSSRLDPLPEEQRNEIIRQTEALLKPRLFIDDTWVGDYRRLRFTAVKQ